MGVSPGIAARLTGLVWRARSDRPSVARALQQSQRSRPAGPPQDPRHGCFPSRRTQSPSPCRGLSLPHLRRAPGLLPDAAFFCPNSSAEMIQPRGRFAPAVRKSRLLMSRTPTGRRRRNADSLINSNSASINFHIRYLSTISKQLKCSPWTLHKPPRSSKAILLARPLLPHSEWSTS